MLRAQVKIPDSPGASWGLGIAIAETPHGIHYGHGGRNPGFTSLSVMYKDRGIGYVFLVNNDDASKFENVLNAYLIAGKSGLKKTATIAHKAARVDPKVYDAYVGRFAIGPSPSSRSPAREIVSLPNPPTRARSRSFRNRKRMALGFVLRPLPASASRFTPGDGQDLVGLGPALDRAGSTRPGRSPTRCPPIAASSAAQGADAPPSPSIAALLERRHRLQRTLETHLSRRHPGLRRGPQHRATDQIITE